MSRTRLLNATQTLLALLENEASDAEIAGVIEDITQVWKPEDGCSLCGRLAPDHAEGCRYGSAPWENDINTYKP